MKKNFTWLISVCIVGMVSAQKNTFTVGLGYQRTFMLDKQASPLKYQTSEKTIQLGFAHHGENIFVSRIEAAFGKLFPTGLQGRQMYNSGYNNDGTPKKDSSSMIGTIYNPKVAVGYLKHVSNGHGHMGNNDIYSDKYVGVSFQDQLFYTDNMVRAGWLNCKSLNVEYQQMMSLQSKHYLTLKLSIPIFARNTRLPYHNTVSAPDGDSNIKSFFKQGSRFVSLASFQNVQLLIDYDYSLGKHTSIGVHYFGQVLHYHRELPVNLFQNNVSLTAAFK